MLTPSFFMVRMASTICSTIFGDNPSEGSSAAPATDCPSMCARSSASAARRRSCVRRDDCASRQDWGTAQTVFPASIAAHWPLRLAADLEIFLDRQISEDSALLRHIAEARARSHASARARRPGPRTRCGRSAARRGRRSSETSSTCRRRCARAARPPRHRRPRARCRTGYAPGRSGC